MKIISIPAPLKIKVMERTGTLNQVETKFVEWATNIIDFYAEAKTLKQVRQVQKIVEALESSNGTVSIEDAEYELLKAAVEQYPTKLPPAIVRQHLSFVDAIEKADDVKK